MDGLDLSLPNRQPQSGRPSRLVIALAVLILLAVIANTAVVLRLSLGSSSAGVTGHAALSPEQHKQLALKLEKQGLQASSVDAWIDYLNVADLPVDDRARIWYRVGTLQEDALDHAAALVSYYRSESLSPVEDLRAEIARRTRECLESMGRFAALRYELEDRVDLDADSGSSGDIVVAEIGSQPITQAELDRRIETLIQRQLASMASYLPEEEQKRQKEALLKQYATSMGRQQLLTQFIAEEILYRRARQSKLADDPEVRALLQAQEHALLAQQVMTRELADRIELTPADLTAYYEAHPEEFAQPEGEPPGPRPFDEVQGEVFARVRAQREQEVQQELFMQLKDEYDVVIHQSAFAEAATEEPE